MGRTKQARWTLRPRGPNGTLYVRFRANGHRVEESTGTSDDVAAAAEAEKIFRRVIDGRVRPGALSPRLPLHELAAAWLVDLVGSAAPRSIDLYASHLRAHLLPHFERLDRVTTATIADYISKGLRRVLRNSVKTELKTLKRFLLWLKTRETIATLPAYPAIPHVTGTRNPKKKAGPTEISPEQARAFVLALPEWSTGRAGRHERFPVRARFVFAWETGLRPSTLDKLRAPEHWTGGAELVITDDVDKARFGRTVPLTPLAQAALRAVAPPVGLIFGRKDARSYVHAAREAAGLPETFSPYDLRHSRATSLAETGNLVGLAFIMGHRKVTTTAVYVKPNRRAAEDMLARDPERPQLPAHVGAGSGAPGPGVCGIADERRCFAPQSFNPWEGTDRVCCGDPEVRPDQERPENAVSPSLLGALPPELPGLVKGRVALGLWEVLEEYIARLDVAVGDGEYGE